MIPIPNGKCSYRTPTVKMMWYRKPDKTRVFRSLQINVYLQSAITAANWRLVVRERNSVTTKHQINVPELNT